MSDKQKPGNIYRVLLIIIGILFILFSIAILAAGIWFFIERNYMSSVMQSDLFSAGSIMLFIVGVVIFIISFFGCFGAYRGIRWMLFTYFGVNLFVVLLALCAAFVAVSFQSEIGGILKSNMEDTLIKRYKNNTHNTTINRVVTEAWDRMQVRLNCCAVDDEGWEIYQRSSWYLYKRHNNFEISKIDLVPVSCCTRPQFDWDRVINEFTCTKTQGGPPASKIGSFNDFLNYKGCYGSAKKALGELIWFIFAFGLIVTILIIVGMVSAICLAKKIKKARNEKYPPNRSPARPQRRQQEYDY